MSKIKTNTNSAYLAAALAAIEPLINALDMDVGEGDQDTGHERPSQRDVGIRIVLGGFCQSLHNQLFGEYTTSTGSKIPNVYQRFMDSEEHTGSKEFQQRLEDGNLSQADMKALDWYAKNEARFNWLTEMHNVYCELYENVTGEKWKPYVKAATETKMTDNRKALIEKLKASKVA